MDNLKATLKATLLAGTALLLISSAAATVKWGLACSTDSPSTANTCDPAAVENAGPQMRVPLVNGLPMTLVAEDDNKQPDNKQADNKQSDNKQPDNKQPDTALWLKEYTPTTTPMTQPNPQSGDVPSDHDR